MKFEIQKGSVRHCTDVFVTIFLAALLYLEISLQRIHVCFFINWSILARTRKVKTIPDIMTYMLYTYAYRHIVGLYSAMWTQILCLLRCVCPEQHGVHGLITHTPSKSSLSPQAFIAVVLRQQRYENDDAHVGLISLRIFQQNWRCGGGWWE